MVPSGTISLGGANYDAVSQAGVIDEGHPVQVVTVDGTRIMVRKLDGDLGQPTATNEDPGSKIVEDPFSEPLI